MASLLKLTGICASPYTTPLFALSGQVAQLVERGPEKAGVGGSIPSLATINFTNLQIPKNIQKSSREQYANVELLTFSRTRLSLVIRAVFKRPYTNLLSD